MSSAVAAFRELVASVPEWQDAVGATGTPAEKKAAAKARIITGISGTFDSANVTRPFLIVMPAEENNPAIARGSVTLHSFSGSIPFRFVFGEPQPEDPEEDPPLTNADQFEAMETTRAALKFGILAKSGSYTTTENLMEISELTMDSPTAPALHEEDRDFYLDGIARFEAGR